MKKIFLRIVYSFSIVAIGFILSNTFEALVRRENSDPTLNMIYFLIIYLIFIVGYFSLRIIDLLKARNTVDYKNDNENE